MIKLDLAHLFVEKYNCKECIRGSYDWYKLAYLQCVAVYNEKGKSEPVKTAACYQYMSGVCGIFYFN